ncbi:MAG TPA: efflux transporter periplasmic adaptor subunit, partial [Candidatus Accumulibacter sp.]|nr:efflux transporter periplasmic adaptor subunit [Accumulibacter sp.]
GYLPVCIGPAQGSERIGPQGLQAGERAIVSGLMRVRPGMTVQPQPADAAAAAVTPAPQGPAPDRS